MLFSEIYRELHKVNHYSEKFFGAIVCIMKVKFVIEIISQNKIIQFFP